MSDMKEFRSIADEIMSDINVSDNLKKKILMRCKNKSHVHISRILVPAACFVLILGIVGMSGLMQTDLLQPKTQPGTGKTSEMDLTADANGSPGTLMAEADDNVLPDSGVTKDRVFTTLEEAEKSFGDVLLTPSHIPEGFSIDRIYVSGAGGVMAAKAVISYVSEDRSFIITEEKTDLHFGFNDFSKVDINGATGYLKSAGSDGNGDAAAADAELHWFADGVHCTIAGLITDDEVLEIARLMK